MSFKSVRARKGAALILGAALVAGTLASRIAAAAPPPIGAEEPVSSTIIGAAAEQQQQPAIAYNGTKNMVVWRDARDPSGTAHIWGSLVNTNGSPASVMGRQISSGPSAQDPDVASDGTDFLVVWDQAGQIWGAIVQDDGSTGVVGAPFAIFVSVGSQQSGPDVAFNGTDYLVTWVDHSTGEGDIVAARVTPTGTVTDTTPIPVANDPDTSQGGPTVASVGGGGADWMIAWHDYTADPDGDVYGTLIADDGTVTTADGVDLIATADADIFPQLASNGAGYLLVWDAYDGLGNSSIRAARMEDDGSVTDAGGVEIAAPDDVSIGTGQPGAIPGGDYIIPWSVYDALDENNRKVVARILADSDASLSAPIDVGPLLGGIGQRPAASSDGTDFMVLYGDDDIFAEGVEADGDPKGSDSLVTNSATRQPRGDVAPRPGGFFAVWEELRDDQVSQVNFGRLDADGSFLDGVGTPAYQDDQPQIMPAVAFNGTEYLLVWLDYNYAQPPDVVGMRVDADGNLIDTTPLVIQQAADGTIQSLDVASDGTDFLVVWTPQAASNDVAGKFVLADGQMPDESFIIVDDPDSQLPASVAGSANGYVVVWQDANVQPDGGVGAVAVDPDAVGDPVGTQQILSPANAAFPSSPVVASSGTGFMAAWSQGSGSDDIWIHRLDASGSKVGVPTRATQTSGVDERTTDISFDGYDYVVFGQRGSDDVVVARRIRVNGTVVDSTGFDVATGERIFAQAMGSRGEGRSIFLYGRYDSGEEYGGVDRLFTRTMLNVPVPLMRQPKTAFQTKKGFVVAWTKPADRADVRLRQASSTAGFGAYSMWQTSTTATQASYTGKPGSTYCFSARSRDVGNNLSDFSADRCTAVPLDDTALASKGSWSHGKGKGYYLNTFSKSSSKGAALSKKVRGKRFALVATKCRGCGTVKVFFGKKLLKKVALGSSSTRKKRVIALGGLGSAKTGTLRIVVVSSGKPVIIEGAGVSAV